MLAKNPHTIDRVGDDGGTGLTPLLSIGPPFVGSLPNRHGIRWHRFLATQPRITWRWDTSDT
jgi:hypothetical protein